MSDNITEGKNAIFTDPVRKPIELKTGLKVWGYKTKRELTREIKNTQTELQEVNLQKEEHEENSLTDTLTGLPNRRFFDEHMASLMEGENPQFSLLMVDIDHFKEFNDEHGHIVGDEALKFVAKHLLSSIRDKDTLARYGGEEFMAELPGPIGNKNVLNIAKRFQEGLDEINNDSARCFKVRSADGTQQPVRLTVSVGATEYYPDTDERDWKRTYIRTDKALYIAKRKRNDISFLDHLEAVDLTKHVTELKLNKDRYQLQEH